MEPDVHIEEYTFDEQTLREVEESNRWVKDSWPVIYLLRNGANNKREAYVGESTNARNRMKQHLHGQYRKMQLMTIIGADTLNKSATLDIESKLIEYMGPEGTYTLLNKMPGLKNHRYYQQEVYEELFEHIWQKLKEKQVVHKDLGDIKNSEVFKFSPYKQLNTDQYESLVTILEFLADDNANTMIINGGAGTGKTVLAVYLMKLLTTKMEDIQESEDLSEYGARFSKLLKGYLGIGDQSNNTQPREEPRIGLVVAMSSLRKTLQRVFRDVPGLRRNMVIGPTDSFGTKKYDLLIVDEAHRLRRYKSIGWMGAFKKMNQRLGLGDEGTELDWIMHNSKKQILFYDEAQSVRPSDVDKSTFAKLQNHAVKIDLKSQMRVMGGNGYIQFIRNLLHVNTDQLSRYQDENYDVLLFETMQDLHREIISKEKQYGLCRIVAGFSWPWISNKKSNAGSADVTDIEIDGLQFRWNSKTEDWVHSENAVHEVGCIHTTQGYDLNYAAIIFGHEIDYDHEKGEITIDPDKYHDTNGKKSIDDPAQLKEYIVNIYQTLMTRGIRGTYVYACNPRLRDYFREYLEVY